MENVRRRKYPNQFRLPLPLLPVQKSRNSSICHSTINLQPPVLTQNILTRYTNLVSNSWILVSFITHAASNSTGSVACLSTVAVTLRSLPTWLCALMNQNVNVSKAVSRSAITSRMNGSVTAWRHSNVTVFLPWSIEVRLWSKARFDLVCEVNWLPYLSNLWFKNSHHFDRYNKPIVFKTESVNSTTCRYDDQSDTNNLLAVHAVTLLLLGVFSDFCDRQYDIWTGQRICDIPEDEQDCY